MRAVAGFEHLVEAEEVKALIAERAHQLYLQRGAEAGKDWDDWFQAENDILELALFIDCAFRTYGNSAVFPDADHLSSGEANRPHEFA